MKLPSPTLVQLLIGKSILETILVGTLAAIAFLAVLPPTFHGWGEFTANSIAGWAVNNGAPYERVEVQLFIDGKFVAGQIANQSRPDVSRAGWARDEWHGYQFMVGPISSGSHEARIYALHISRNNTRRSLQLLGDPIPFTSAANSETRQPISAK